MRRIKVIDQQMADDFTAVLLDYQDIRVGDSLELPDDTHWIKPQLIDAIVSAAKDREKNKGNF